MARVDVSPDLIKWAINRTDKAQALEQDFPVLKWISREKQPTLKQLEKFAKATSTPVGLFFLPTPPVEKLSIPNFRTIEDNKGYHPSPDLLETVQTMERRQEWIRSYFVDQSYDPLTFVGSAKRTDNIKLVAKAIRITLGLNNGWAAGCSNWQEALRMLQRKVEAAGIFVFVSGIVGNNTHRKLNVNEFRGFVLVDDFAPVVFINGADGKAAQMFTLAHELAHIWFGASAAFDLNNLEPSLDEIEVLCNKVAAEFLIPEEELYTFWKKVHRDDDRFGKIARQFKVSEIVAARRALDLKFINKSEFFEFYNVKQQEMYEQTTNGGGDFYRTQAVRIGRRFAETVITATKEGSLLYREAYRLTGLNGRTFSELAERLGAGGEL